MRFKQVIALVIIFCLMISNVSNVLANDALVGNSQQIIELDEKDTEMFDIGRQVLESESSLDDYIDNSNQLDNHVINGIDQILATTDSNTEALRRYIFKPKTNDTILSRQVSQLDIVDINNVYDINSSESQAFEEIEFISAMTVQMTASQAQMLVDQNLVEYIELDQEIKIANDIQQNISDQVVQLEEQLIPWGIYSTGAYAVNANDNTGDIINVAVFDTGISLHSEIIIAGGISFVDENGSHHDDHGHGTQIAGTINAIDDHRGIVGSTSNVNLYSVKTIDGQGKGYISSVIQGLEWALDNDIDIINLSFVSSSYSQLLHEAIQIATDNGILIIAAA